MHSLGSHCTWLIHSAIRTISTIVSCYCLARIEHPLIMQILQRGGATTGTTHPVCHLSCPGLLGGTVPQSTSRHTNPFTSNTQFPALASCMRFPLIHACSKTSAYFARAVELESVAIKVQISTPFFHSFTIKEILLQLQKDDGRAATSPVEDRLQFSKAAATKQFTIVVWIHAHNLYVLRLHSSR